MVARVIGRYALHDEIAAGGMASVHIGRLMGTIGFARTVAVKRLHPQMAREPEFVAMLLDEARLAARIHHPNVVQTLDVVAAEGEVFLVMEYVQGETLGRLARAALTRGTPLPVPMVGAIMAGVLHGLHAAHEARSERGDPLGIVHRDVSPQNVIVGVDGIARVLDFGVAKAIGRLQSTREGQLKGKLAYMAPEQLDGRSDRRTDVYAASVVLWEMLAGRRLFKGETEAEVFGKVREGRVVAPSSFAPVVPARLDAITLRGLQQDPAHRFSTAREMACAIEDALPALPASRIGDWVRTLADETLSSRARRLQEIEADSSTTLPPLAASAEVPTEVSMARPVSGDRLGHEGAVVAAPGPSARGAPAVGERRRRVVGRWVAGIGTLGVAAALAGAFLWRGQGAPPVVAQAPAVPAPPPASPAPIPPTSEPAPSPSSPPSPPPSPPVPSSAASGLARDVPSGRPAVSSAPSVSPRARPPGRRNPYGDM
jgi:serine/threonine-protein kinase